MFRIEKRETQARGTVGREEVIVKCVLISGIFSFFFFFFGICSFLIRELTFIGNHIRVLEIIFNSPLCFLEPEWINDLLMVTQPVHGRARDHTKNSKLHIQYFRY